MSGVRLVGEGSWKSSFWISGCSQRRFLLCRRTLVGTSVSDLFRLITRGCAATGCQLKNDLEGTVAVLPSSFDGFSKGCRPYLLTSDFARGGDMMIGNEGTGGIHLYCPLVRCRMVFRRRQNMWWLTSCDTNVNHGNSERTLIRN